MPGKAAWAVPGLPGGGRDPAGVSRRGDGGGTGDGGTGRDTRLSWPGRQGGGSHRQMLESSEGPEKGCRGVTPFKDPVRGPSPGPQVERAGRREPRSSHKARTEATRQEGSVGFSPGNTPLLHGPSERRALGETEAGGGASAWAREGTDVRPTPPTPCFCSPISPAGGAQNAFPCEKQVKAGRIGFLDPLLCQPLGNGPSCPTAWPQGPSQAGTPALCL